MKKIISFIPVFIIVGIVVACNNSTGSMSGAGPKEVLHEFFERMKKKDIDGASMLTTTDSKFVMEQMKMFAEQKLSDSVDKNDPSEKFKDLEIGEAKINGENASVPVNSRENDFAIDFPLKKEQGNWKVDFSLSTWMKIGMDEAKKRGMDADDMQDMMQKGMKMKDSIIENMDSETKKKMERGLKSYDSLMKAN